MGLAASQARFLGITLRKANCEFKATELAQQRLELTNQMTDISQEYSNALNSTKLVWANDAVTDSFGNPGNYALSYSLMMMPSPANDYNPYMFSTRSGAIVLNSKYADAAEYAGISMGGGTPSQAGRDRFLAALANQDGLANKRAKGDNDTNVITVKTYEMLTDKNSVSDVRWHSSAGMGAVPREKGVSNIKSLNDLVHDKDIGGQALDWLQIYKVLLGGDNYYTQYELDKETAHYKDAVVMQKQNYMNAKDASGNSYSHDYVIELESAARKEYASMDGIMKQFKELEEKITPPEGSQSAPTPTQINQYKKELENLKNGYVKDGSKPIDGDQESLLKYPLYWAIYEQEKMKAKSAGTVVSWAADDNYFKAGDSNVGFKQLFYTDTSSNSGIGGQGSPGNKGMQINADTKFNILTLCVNDVMLKDQKTIKNMTIADLLTSNITIIAEQDGSESSQSRKTIETAAKAMLKSIAGVFGYGKSGVGLNVDNESQEALEYALNMTEKIFLKANNAVDGDKNSDDHLKENSAYLNAQEYNRIGSGKEYAAVNLSNMLSAFLTYYDNALRGTDSTSVYTVGKSNKDGRTNFVTDDPEFRFVTNSQGDFKNEEKIADFFNQLYNNICEHGWRYDDMVQSSEHLESAVKDGRYQIMVLNNDGYFYQMRYNEIAYMQEVQDTDAIARAESEYQTKKAQITFKEDQIDVKTKKLDAEISELNTEINSVQNIISKSIEKTFSMFSN